MSIVKKVRTERTTANFMTPLIVWIIVSIVIVIVVVVVGAVKGQRPVLMSLGVKGKNSFQKSERMYTR